jgi:purine-nucleoside phosphorylase
MLTSKEVFEFIRDYEINVQKASKYLSRRILNQNPTWALTLGTGLGSLVDELEDKIVVFNRDIPGYPIPSVRGHEGKVIFGKLENKPVIVSKSRIHYYEVANDPSSAGILDVVFPIHVLANLGVKNYFATNAVGGLNPNYQVGDLVVIKSHLNIFGIPNPLAGREKNFGTVDGGLTERFVPTNGAYNKRYREELLEEGIIFPEHVHEGVYAAFPGPSFETEAECLAARKLGADVVGMSLAPEVLVARQRGMNVAALSCVTNMIQEDGTNATSSEEVSKILESPQVKRRLETLVRRFFRFRV